MTTPPMAEDLLLTNILQLSKSAEMLKTQMKIYAMS